MRKQKGFSLMELLIVLLIVLFIILTTSYAVIQEVDKARAATLLADARMARNTAQIVLIELQAMDTTQYYDEQYEEGLTGLVRDATKPVETQMSRRMNELMGEVAALSDEPGEHQACLTFDFDQAQFVQMTYDTLIGKRQYRVTLRADGTVVSERIVN